MAEDLLHAGRAAVDIIPRVNPAAFTAGIRSAVNAAQAEIAAAADGPLAARLAASSSAITGIGKALAPASKAAAVFGATTVASAVSVDHAYHLLEQRTGAVGGKLEELETIAARSALATGAGFKQVAADEANLAQRLGASGPVLQGLTTQFENLRFVQGEQAASVDQVSAAFAQFGIPAKDASHAMDLLFVAAQKSGAGTAQLTDSLVAQGGVLRSVGLSYDQSVALLGTLAKAGIPAQAVMAGLRKEFSQAAKDGVPANEALANTIAKIKELIDTGRSTEAAGIATKIFGGRGAALLFDAIKQGKLNTDDFAASLGAANGAINRTANETEDFGRQLGKVKDQVELSLKPLGDSILPSVIGGLHGAATGIGAVGGALKASGLDSVLGTGIVAAAATSGVLRLGGAIGTLAANRAKDLTTLTGYSAATAAATVADGAYAASLLGTVVAARAVTVAQEQLDEAVAVYGPTSTEAAVASGRLTAAQEAQAIAAKEAAAAEEAAAVANTEVASTGRLASASIGTVATAAVAAYAGFQLGTTGLHALESALNGPSVNAKALTKDLQDLADTGSLTGELASHYQHLSSTIATASKDSLSHRFISKDLLAADLATLTPFPSLINGVLGRIHSDKANDELKKLDGALADLVSSGHTKEAVSDLDAIARANGLTYGEISSSLSTYGRFSDALLESANAAEKAAKAHGYLNAKDEELAKTARTLVDDTLAVPKAQDSALSASLSLTSAENAHADAQANLQHLLHGYPAASDEAKQAEESYASALQSTIDKRDAIVDAQRKYDDVQRQGIENEIKLREATESANNSLLDKTDALTKAKDEEEKLRARGADHHDIEEAARATARAQREVAAGREKVADARRDQADGPRKQAEAEADAAKAIVKAKRDSEDATKSLAKAVTDLDTVLHGRPATDKKVRDAQLLLDQSTVGLRDAQLNTVDSALALNDANRKVADDLLDPKLGANAALLAEVDALKKIEIQSPLTVAALDPLIKQILTIAWVNGTEKTTDIFGKPGSLPPGLGHPTIPTGGHPFGGLPRPRLLALPGTSSIPSSDHLSTSTMEGHLAKAVEALNTIATHVVRNGRGGTALTGSAGGSDDAWATTAGGIRY